MFEEGRGAGSEEVSSWLKDVPKRASKPDAAFVRPTLKVEARVVGSDPSALRRDAMRLEKLDAVAG